MSPLTSILQAPLLQTLAWALLHFLWQGLALWALTGSLLYLLRHRSAQARYLVACLGLLGCLLMPLGTWLLGWKAGWGPAQAILLVEAGSGGLSMEQLGWTLRLKTWMLPRLPFLMGVWMCGSAWLGLRLSGGWLWLQRLRMGGRSLPSDWETRIRELALQWNVKRAFRACISDRVDMPMVIGALRPVILLPAQVLTGLEPWAIECLLVHKLAHIRRHDYAFNLMQSLIEVLLFYHPAVWWISRRVRTEREICCDETAVAHGGDAHRYAETLNHLDDLRSIDPESLAMAAGGGNLMQRIQRLLIPPQAPVRSLWAAPLATVILASLLSTALVAKDTPKTSAAASSNDTDAPPPPPPPPPPVPPAPPVPSADRKVVKIEKKSPESLKNAEASADMKSTDFSAGKGSSVSFASYSRSVKIDIRPNNEVVFLRATLASVQEIRQCLKAAGLLNAGTAKKMEKENKGFFSTYSWEFRGALPPKPVSVSFNEVDLKTLQDLPDDAYLIEP